MNTVAVKSFAIIGIFLGTLGLIVLLQFIGGWIVDAIDIPSGGNLAFFIKLPFKIAGAGCLGLAVFLIQVVTKRRPLNDRNKGGTMRNKNEVSLKSLQLPWISPLKVVHQLG